MNNRDVETIDKAFCNLAKLKMQLAETEAQVEMWQGLIKEYMEKSGIDTLQGTEHKATYKAVTSSRIDKKALAADYPDIADLYTKITETKRFNFI